MKIHKKRSKQLGFKNQVCVENRLFGNTSSYFSFKFCLAQYLCSIFPIFYLLGIQLTVSPRTKLGMLTMMVILNHVVGGDPMCHLAKA